MELKQLLAAALGKDVDENDKADDGDKLDGLSGRQRRRARRAGQRAIAKSMRVANRAHQRQVEAQRWNEGTLVAQARVLLGESGNDEQRRLLRPAFEKRAAEQGVTLEEALNAILDTLDPQRQPQELEPVT